MIKITALVKRCEQFMEFAVCNNLCNLVHTNLFLFQPECMNVGTYLVIKNSINFERNNVVC